MTDADTMWAVRFHRKGGPGVLCHERVPTPRAARGQVLVRVEAAGINYADIVRRSGDSYPLPTRFPCVPGNEFAGTVARVGGGVSEPAVGTSVFGFADPVTSGCYAQYVAVPAGQAFALPDGLDPADATALLVQGLTALLALKDGLRVGGGQSVLVLAAAGGVGSLAVQLARTLGAGRVVGAASSPEKLRLVRELGADDAVDYTKQDWAAAAVAANGGRGFEGALVSGGRRTVSESFGALAPLGRAMLLGGPDDDALVVDFLDEVRQGRLAMNETVGFFRLSAYSDMDAMSEVLSALDVLVAEAVAGRLRPVSAHRLPLSAAAHAHELIERRATTGKVVLLPWPDTISSPLICPAVDS